MSYIKHAKKHDADWYCTVAIVLHAVYNVCELRHLINGEKEKMRVRMNESTGKTPKIIFFGDSSS